MQYSETFKKVVDAVLGIINKQEEMHAFNMQTSREVGAEVMFFDYGTVAIEPNLSCSGTQVDVGEEIIDPKSVADFLISCSTSFREKYNAEVDTSHKTSIIRIKKAK